MQAGPESAGAFPGPVCYNLGGETPTITDANVLLGYINPRHLIGGALKLNSERARALAGKLARIAWAVLRSGESYAKAGGRPAIAS